MLFPHVHNFNSDFLSNKAALVNNYIIACRIMCRSILCLHLAASELICKSVLKVYILTVKINVCMMCMSVIFTVQCKRVKTVKLMWSVFSHRNIYSDSVTSSDFYLFFSSFPAVFRQFSKNAGNSFKSDDKWTLATRVWELKPFLPSTYISRLRSDIWKCIAAQLNMSEQVWQIWIPVSGTFSTLPFS